MPPSETRRDTMRHQLGQFVDTSSCGRERIFQRIEAHSVAQVVRSKMGISHRLLDVMVAQNFLQREDVATGHHKM